MSVPIWMLLAFATWTLLLLLSTIGVYRWGRILSGKSPINGFRADQVEGADWYKRSMRAHANCVENLPVFGAIVFALSASHLGNTAIDLLSVTIVGARIIQSLVHICFPQTNTVAGIRFAFFFVQLSSFLILIAMIIKHAALAS